MQRSRGHTPSRPCWAGPEAAGLGGHDPSWACRATPTWPPEVEGWADLRHPGGGGHTAAAQQVSPGARVDGAGLGASSSLGGDQMSPW